jgi:hypothetical protein
MDMATRAKMAFSGTNHTVDPTQLEGVGQIKSLISGFFEGWTNLQLFVTFVLLCATYDQGMLLNLPSVALANCSR